jgi:integrase
MAHTAGNPAQGERVCVRITLARLGALQTPAPAMHEALQSAGIESLTIHGLRRSFSLLGEAAGAPAGAIAQVMGHKPSATAEGYRPRSVDALRSYLAQIEAHILEQAGVSFLAGVQSRVSWRWYPDL